MIRSRSCLQALIAAAVLAAAACVRADEFDTLRLKWREMLTHGTNASFSDPLYQSWISSLGSTALSYKNTINTSPTRTNLWNAYPNPAADSSDISGTYSRLRTMALAYSVRDTTVSGDASLLAVILDGLDWMYANYYNPTGVVYDNWFDFEIASPLALNDAVVLLYSNLSPARINNYMSAVDHFTPTPNYSVISTNLTAANKIWKSVVVAVRGTVVRDGAKIDLARQGLSDVFPYVTTGDGFYADGSFIFHNYFPYNAGYGVELLDSTAQLMQLLRGSTWQITDPAQTNVFRWVSDSFEPFIVRGAAMEMVDGRYHTRDGDGHERGHELLGAILRIAEVAPPSDAVAFKSFVKGAIQADKYRYFITAQTPPYNVWGNAVVNDPSVVALSETAQHRQFPGMDRVIHRTPGWTFGLAMSSWRVANYESTRGENLRGWFTGDGMTYLYNGDLGQYSDDFWSTVDPYRMPGTTLEATFRANGSGDNYRAPTNNQVGGASIQGLYGVTAMHLNSYGTLLSARKSWFMFDNEIVCLGNSVSGGTNGAAETIIENRRLGLYGNNAFTVNSTLKPAGPGWAETMAGTSWAHLAGTTPGADIGYFFPPAATVKALRESRSGAFKDINTTYGSSARSTRHYLTMYFDHGTNPSGGTYAYVLLPGMSASSVAGYASNPDITVVQNNSIATAVRENKLAITAVNFWRDMSNTVGGITADRKSSVISRNDGSVLEIGVADTTQTNTDLINVEVSTPAVALLSADPGVSVIQLTPTVKITASVSNKLGATLRARFAVGTLATTNLPVADAYVQNGDQTNVNNGGSATLPVKLASGSSLSRESYLRFDLSSIPGTILSANLRLLPVTTNEVISNAVAFVADDSWSEAGITWNTKPASDLEYARWSVPPERTPILIPVTSLAQQAAAGDGKLSLRIFSTSTGTNGGFTAYGSKENGTATNRPQLLVTFIRVAPTVTLSTTSDAALDAPGTVALSAEAQDGDGTIAGVDFYDGTAQVAHASAPPYQVTIPNLAAGNYTFTAVATDNAGFKATSSPVNIAVYLPEPAGRGTGLNAEYYFDQNLTTLAATRIDPAINFSWGLTNPSGGSATAPFSVRWIGKLQARQSGLHQLHAVTDEGVRLWIDGQLVIDNWTAHFQTEDTGSISLIAGRYYDITMEYYDAALSAVAKLYWTPPGAAKEIIPQSQLYPADQGLRAVYYSGTTLFSPAFTRIDDAVNFNWGTNSPDPTVLTGPFSIRWTGKVRANLSGTYTFFTLSDDAVRLSVNGSMLINNWVAHAQTEDSNTITLAAGQYYDLTMEYFNAAGMGTAVLMWQPPGELKQPIPTTNLTPHRNNNPPSLGAIPQFVAARNELVTFTASATDADAPGQSLTFSLDADAPPGASIHPGTGVFSWTPSNAQPFGPIQITVRVTDDGSPEMSDAQTFTVTILTNMSTASVTLVPIGGTWRYLDTNVDQGSAWRSVGFNDSSWKTGAGKFGYGIGDETTVTSFGSNASNKYITTYFRRAFYVPDPALIQTLSARLMRDDGAVIYLNGAEIWRDNMPAGTISFSTLASSAITGANQTQFVSRALSPSVLVGGSNVIAVELHQDSPSTPDARFDLELSTLAFVPSASPVACVRSASAACVMWPEAAGLLRLYSATNLTQPTTWLPVNTIPVLSNGQWSVQIFSTNNSMQFYRLQNP